MARPRHIMKKVELALGDTPVILINGARQVGKSTLAKGVIEHGYPATYFTLDNSNTLAAITADPSHFIASLRAPAVIDEVQRAPELFLAIKEAIDRNRQPGRFLLTGSANVLLLPRLSDSLAGRMEIINLWPLSQGEIHGNTEYFIDAIFASHFNFPSQSSIDRNTQIERVLLGGYPEILTRPTEERRNAWYESYIMTILQRDIRDIAHIEGLTQLPRLLRLLATRTGGLFNLAEISRVSGIANTTLSRYITLLQTIFLINTVPAWSTNHGKRLIKSPKLYLCDTGLAAHLLGLTRERVLLEPDLFSPILENFIALELKKQLGWNKTRADLFHYRTSSGQEVDFILESKAGDIVGIEVKTSSSINESDFKGLHHLAAELGKKFIRGIVLYTAQQTLAFGKNLYGVPMSLTNLIG